MFNDIIQIIGHFDENRVNHRGLGKLTGPNMLMRLSEIQCVCEQERSEYRLLKFGANNFPGEAFVK